MTYPEQLKQKTNEELILKRDNLRDTGYYIKADKVKAEILSRMKQPSQEYSNPNQRLFDYFKQEHDIMLMDGDYNEIKNILQPSQEHLKEALEEIANYPHAYNSQIDIQEIAKEALNQK